MTLTYSHIQTLIILINLTVGYVVWTYNSKSYLNRILAFIILCILFIDLSFLFYLKIEGERYLQATIILGSLGISFFPPLFYTLSLFYPIRKRFKRGRLYLVYGIALFLSLFILLSFPKQYIIQKLSLPTDLREISLRNMPLVFVFLYFLLTSYSLVLLFFTARNFISSMKAQIIPFERRTVQLLSLIGLPLAYLVSIVSVINYFFYIPFPWVGFLLFLFTSFVVILVFRFHIVDLKHLLGGILFYPALIGILVLIYISVVLKYQNRIAQVLALPENVTLILEVFIIYLAMSTLRRIQTFSYLKKRFPNVSPSVEIDIEPLEYLSYALTIKGLYKRLQPVLHRYSKSEGNLMLLRNRERKIFESVDPTHNLEIPESSELMSALQKLNRGVTLEELLLHLNSRDEIESLYAYGINLVLPINKGSDIIAFILLPKRGIISRWSYEDIYSLNYLKAVLPSLIDRCQMYENEREIEKHQYRMEQLMVIGEMASGFAHEIRNPLSIISTSVETILRNDIHDDDRIKMLQFIKEETNRINILANKLLSVNFQKKPELERFELSAILHKLGSFLEYQLKDRNILFSIKNRNSHYLYSDPNILFQILLNLALNSIEAIDREGHMSIDYKGDNTTLSIFVEDDGPGIPPKQRARVFEPFYTTKKRGTGLGLTVTKKLIENLFGYIELQPSRQGAVFKVILPIRGVGESKA
jgi:signal transduction histidine kinase